MKHTDITWKEAKEYANKHGITVYNAYDAIWQEMLSKKKSAKKKDS